MVTRGVSETQTSLVVLFPPHSPLPFSRYRLLLQYKLGQIYMVAKLCSEMTDAGDGAGVESIANQKCTLEGHGELPV